MKTFRLTLAQLRNLKELRDDLEGKLPPTILTKVPPRQLARWLRNPPFRDRVEALLEVVRFRQDNALDLAATRAAEQISAALADKAGIDTPELRPLAEIIKLALAARSSKARRQRTAENSKNRRNEKILQPPPNRPAGAGADPRRCLRRRGARAGPPAHGGPAMTALSRLLLRPCRGDDELHAWVRLYTGLDVPRRAVCAGHDAPFDYLRYSYFEPASDLVVWAPRGGGKTRLAAVATLLDLLHKPPASVRILGGSLEQSMKMWDYLLPDLDRLARGLLARRVSEATRRIRLVTGSEAAVLTQSQRAVRGLRVQKLRCDEIELFDPKIW